MDDARQGLEVDRNPGGQRVGPAGGRLLLRDRTDADVRLVIEGSRDPVARR
ncbi:MAG: hypothetical protein ACRCZD_18020 [Phycicoccus sp.]